jgi:phage shock protein A
MMNENIAIRVNRIISAGASALVGSIENSNPAMIMEQALREIDAALDEVRDELGKVAAGLHLAQARLNEEQQRHAALADQTETAVRENREDLASAAIARQLDIEARIPLLAQTVDDYREREHELEAYIHALQGRRREMREELVRYVSERQKDRRNGSAGATAASHDVNRKVARAEAVFDRMLEHAGGLPPRRHAIDGAGAAGGITAAGNRPERQRCQWPERRR